VRSLKLGAAGYLYKSAGSEQLTEAVRHVALGKLFITPAVDEPPASALGAGGHEDKSLHELLSQREFQVFTLLSCGASVGEIADRLALSSNTVSTFRARCLEKTGVRIDVEPALYAMQHAS
jgi:DNA-binding NarL/FixJ family response regulator